jgi:predicted DNA-binding mobile mystery protein A
MSNRWLAIKQLDKELKKWQSVNNEAGMPSTGWVKTIRTALSMSAEQLANRLGLSRMRIVQLERAEIHDAITLRTLKEVANAMECEFVYAIVPKNNSTLEDIIKIKAAKISEERISSVAHSMALEKQSLDNNVLKSKKNELAKNLIQHLNKKFWSISEAKPMRPENQRKKLKKLIDHSQKKK